MVCIVTWALATAASDGHSATRQETRIAVIVGANLGDTNDEPLRYAERDARRFRSVLVDLGGVRRQRAILVHGGGPEEVWRALREARGRAAELLSAGKSVTFFFYYSGHGDDETLHLPRGNVSLAALRQAIAEIPADLRISILDACRTGRTAKGVVRGPSFALTVAPDGPRGTIEMRASSAGEVAQESNELTGSIFTHFLVSGLRGAADTDRDGQVTLAELYSHVYRRTLLRTTRGPALQHPSLAVSLAGAGEIVISRPARSSASLELPGGADRYLVFARRTAGVAAEVLGAEPLRLALPQGQYLVARKSGGTTGVALVDLSWGGTKALRDRDFRPVSREELAARGGRVELNPLHLDAQVGLELAPGSAEGGGLRVGAMFSFTHGSMVFSLEAGLVAGGLATPAFTGYSIALTGGPQVAARWFLGRWTIAAFLGVELRYGWQHWVHRDAERMRAAGFGDAESREYGAIGPRAGLRLALPIGAEWAVTLELAASALFRREIDSLQQGGIAAFPVVSSSLGIGYAF